MPRVVTPRSAREISGVVRLAPARDLADLVALHWIVAWDCRGATMTQPVLPDPCVNLAIEPSGTRLYGVVTGRSEHELAGAGLVVGTKFLPGGFSGFGVDPVGAITNRILTLEEAWGRAGTELEAAVARQATVAELIGVVSDFLRARRPPPDEGRSRVMRVVEAMGAADPDARVDALARRFAVAPRTLQRLFATHVGATPKQVLKQFRYQAATDRLEAAGSESLARLAADLGYFDQAHFTSDLRQALGRSPALHARGR